jgi:hypothetical protein
MEKDLKVKIQNTQGAEHAKLSDCSQQLESLFAATIPAKRTSTKTQAGTHE